MKPHTAGSPLGTRTPNPAPPWHPGRAPHPFPSTCPVSAGPGRPGLPRGQRRSGLWEKSLGDIGVRRHGLTQGRGGSLGLGWGHPTCRGLHPPRCPQGKGPAAQGRYPRDAQGERGGGSCLCQVFTPTPLFSYSIPPPARGRCLRAKSNRVWCRRQALTPALCHPQLRNSSPGTRGNSTGIGVSSDLWVSPRSGGGEQGGLRPLGEPCEAGMGQGSCW